MGDDEGIDEPLRLPGQRMWRVSEMDYEESGHPTLATKKGPMALQLLENSLNIRMVYFQNFRFFLPFPA